jgi:hypothetical protein
MRFTRLLLILITAAASASLASCPVSPDQAKLMSGKLPMETANAPSRLAFIGAFGGPGAGEGEFKRIGGLAAAGGRLYVCDQQLARVQIFDYYGKYLGSFGSGLDVDYFGVTEAKLAQNMDAPESELMDPAVVQAIADRQFFRALDVALYQGDVMVLNAFHSRADTDAAMMTPELIRFTPEGKYVRKYDLAALLPGFVDIDEKRGWAAVTDFMNSGFQVYDLEQERFVFGNGKSFNQNLRAYLSQVYAVPNPEQQARRKFEWIQSGSGTNQFDYPNGIAFYRDKVLVVDHNNVRIQIYTDKGGYLDSVEGSGLGRAMKFGEPVDIAVAKDDDVIYVSDLYDPSPGVWAFSAKFEPLYRLEHPELRVPTYVCTSPEGFVFVSELSSNRVFAYGPRDLVLEHERQQQEETHRESSGGQA